MPLSKRQPQQGQRCPHTLPTSLCSYLDSDLLFIDTPGGPDLDNDDRVYGVGTAGPTTSAPLTNYLIRFALLATYSARLLNCLLTSPHCRRALIRALTVQVQKVLLSFFRYSTPSDLFVRTLFHELPRFFSTCTVGALFGVSSGQCVASYCISVELVTRTLSVTVSRSVQYLARTGRRRILRGGHGKTVTGTFEVSAFMYRTVRMKLTVLFR